MDSRKGRLLLLLCVLGILFIISSGQAKKVEDNFSPVVPKTWDDQALSSL